MALNYALKQDTIDKVLIGVDSLAQLQQNLHSITQPLIPKILSQIDSINVKEEELLNPSMW